MAGINSLKIKINCYLKLLRMLQIYYKNMNEISKNSQLSSCL